MQLALAAVGKIFGALGLGAASSGAAAAGAGAAAATAATGSSALLTAGQVVTSLLAAVGTIGAGQQAAAASRQQAVEADLTAGQEQVQAAQRQTAMKRSLLQVLGDNEVSYASAGIDISGGIAQSTATEQKKRAAEELSIDRQDTDFKASLYKMRAQGLRRRAKSEAAGGVIGALGGLANTAIDLAGRG